MIQCDNVRYKDGEQYPSSRPEPAEQAFNILMDCDIGWGAELTEITETKIVTRTDIMGSVDVATYSGSANEMLPLYKAACIATMVDGLRTPEKVDAVMDHTLTKFQDSGVHNPMILTTAVSEALGSGRAYAVYVGLLNPEDADQVQLMCKIAKRDLPAAVNLHLFHGASLAEVMELAA